jgi:hypothetical protein
LKVITRDKISTLGVAFVGTSLRKVAEDFGLNPPISIIDLIRIADLPSPEIEIFKANPVDVPKGGKLTLSWKVKNCEKACLINITAVPPIPDPPSLFSRESEGSVQVQINANTTFTLDARFVYPKEVPPLAKTTVTTVTGFSSIQVKNSHTDERSLHIWIHDLNTATWKEEGLLAFGNSMNVELQDKHNFEFVALDEELFPGCEKNDPQDSACQRNLLSPITGDKDGPVLNHQVF